MATRRRKAIAEALRTLAPLVPFSDAEAIRTAAGGRTMRDLPTAQAVWLATIARIRHAHTDYDELRDEGYERAEARFFVLDATNEVLARWGARRLLRSEPDEAGDAMEDDEGSTDGA